MMKRWTVILGGLMLAACGGVRTGEVVRYDFGTAAGGATSKFPVATVDVQAASWLAGADMHFRLAYAEPQQRRSYGESRWAAPPAELLESALRHRLVFGQAEAGGGCRLQLALGELEQRFDEPQASSIVLDVRAQLISTRGGEALSRRAFQIRRPAAADARGGAAAAREAVQALGDEMAAWLGDLSRDKPVIAARCRS